MMTEFKRKFGKHISDDRLPPQSTFKHFSEKLAEGTLKAEPLSRVISLFEEEQQELKKPEPARQYNLPLVSRLTITAKRRHISSEPADEKGLRLKYAVLTSLWLLAQMRQPGRSIYKDLEKTGLRDFLDTYLKRTTSIFTRKLTAARLSRRVGLSVCPTNLNGEEKQSGFARSSHSVFRLHFKDQEHRVKHWLQLVAVPNSGTSSNEQELQEMRKRIADLEKARSRSPRRNTQSKQAAIAGPSLLALPASSSAPAQGSKGGEESNKKER